MKRLCLSVAAIAALGLSASSVNAAPPARAFRATLTADREVPLVSSDAKGSFRATVAADGNSFDYVLEYEGLEGTVTQSHIHIGQKFAAGGISVWLCKTGLVTPPATVPADTPTCGAPGGDGPEAMGTISNEDVIGPTGQAVTAGQFAELLSLMRSGDAYANVHSTSAPGGEVRGQIGRVRGQSEADHDDRHDH